jgi:cystathionine beta-lyase/cystathionine gamma-synthase
MPAAQRARLVICDSLSVGIEDIVHLKQDLLRSMAAIG